LYGVVYNQVWINNNGNLTFTEGLPSYTATGFPTSLPMVTAFWSDVDTRPVESGTAKYKVFPTRLVITWDTVGYYDENIDKRNTFQIIIGTQNDPIIGTGSNVSFRYKDMQWTTGDVSGGMTVLGGCRQTSGQTGATT
jgi:hypothetical protein